MASLQNMFIIGALILFSTPVLEAKINSTTAFTPNGNYFVLPGKWVGDDFGSAAGLQPSGEGRRYFDLDLDYSTNGYITDVIMMQICDGRSDCDMLQTDGNDHCIVEFFLRDTDKTAYIHRTRCSNGVTGTNVTAVSGGSYKKCSGTSDNPSPLSAFQLPPFLCEQACDNNPSCTMYTVDTSGSNCWLSTFNPNFALSLFIKIPSDVLSTRAFEASAPSRVM